MLLSLFPKKIFCLSLSLGLMTFGIQASSVFAESVEDSLKDSGDQFLFPLHGKSTPQPARPQTADSGSIGDGTDSNNEGSITQGADSATISNSAGDSETVTQSSNNPNGDIVRGKNGQVLAYVDSQSSPGQNRISDPSGNILGTITKDTTQGGYQVSDQYGKPLGSIDDQGEVYNFYGQGIGVVPPGGSPADLYTAWSLIKQH
ncbi:hypothetical protein FAI41_04215 [Acetobacteraceae bacterium]|nr:hypothetical protein FAI41_04215 [Acetobacteraceae bacterium]